MASKKERFEALVQAYSTDLYRYALMLSRNEAVAEDLVQECFLRTWRFLDHLRDESKAKSWLMTTIRRENARRFERFQPGFDDIDLDRIAGRSEVDPEVWTLRKAMLDLPLKYREVLTLHVLGEYSGADISEMLDLPRATVNTRLFRARQQLRKMLNVDELSEPRSADAPNGNKPQP